MPDNETVNPSGATETNILTDTTPTDITGAYDLDILTQLELLTNRLEILTNREEVILLLLLFNTILFLFFIIRSLKND